MTVKYIFFTTSKTIGIILSRQLLKNRMYFYLKSVSDIYIYIYHYFHLDKINDEKKK